MHAQHAHEFEFKLNSIQIIKLLNACDRNVDTVQLRMQILNLMSINVQQNACKSTYQNGVIKWESHHRARSKRSKHSGNHIGAHTGGGETNGGFLEGGKEYGIIR